MASSLPPLPVDPAVRLVAAVADGDLLAELCAAALGAAVASARPRYLEYRPGIDLRLQVQVELEVADVGAVGAAGAAGAAGERRSVVLSQPPDRGAEAASHHRLGVYGAFSFPDDPALPALRRHEGRVLAWVPCRRAVLRQGDEVIKFHAEQAALEQAVLALRSVGAVVPAPEIVGVLARDRAVIQRAVAGRALERVDAAAQAGAAAALVRRLHDSALSTGEARHALAVVGPRQLLALCRPVVALVAQVRPERAAVLGEVVDALDRHAEAAAAGAGDWVASHGDFNIGQLLAGDDGALTVVDTDTLCLAPRAFDLASYAANVVSGRDGDLAEARALLTSLVAGYGAASERAASERAASERAASERAASERAASERAASERAASERAASERAGRERDVGGGDGGRCVVDEVSLAWYLAAMVLRRADRAVRRAKRDWPQRTDRLVDAAAALAAELGRT